MKVIDKIRKAEEEGRFFYSFEYFPPKTPQVSTALHRGVHMTQSTF